MTTAEVAALAGAVTDLLARARTCDEDSPIGAMLARRAAIWREELLDVGGPQDASPVADGA